MSSASTVFLDRERLRALGKDLPEEFGLRKGAETSVHNKAEEDEDGTPILTFRMSTPDVDRDGDTIAVDGWELDNWAKSGSMLWAHDGKIPPVGQPVAAWKEGGALWARVKMVPDSLDYDLGNLVKRMFLLDFLRGVSVGFRPIKYALNEERGNFALDFFEQELVELSATPIPSNPNAVHIMRQVGVDLAPLKDWAERVLDESFEKSGEIYVPAVSLGGKSESVVKEGREAIEAVWKPLVGERKSVVVPKAKDVDHGAEILAELKRLNDLLEAKAGVEPEPKAEDVDLEKEAKLQEFLAAAKKKEEQTAELKAAAEEFAKEFRSALTGRLPV